MVFMVLVSSKVGACSAISSGVHPEANSPRVHEIDQKKNLKERLFTVLIG